MSKKQDQRRGFLYWLKPTAAPVSAKKVELNGRILYDVKSILQSEPAKRHLAALHGAAKR